MTRMGFPAPCMARALVTADHRLAVYRGEPWGELYDLAQDPEESRDLWDDAAHAGHRTRLMEQLAQAMRETVDQSPRAQRRA